MPTDKPRITITIDEETMKTVEEFRYSNRYSSQTQAFLELIKIGLEAVGRTPIKRTPVFSKQAIQIARTYDNELDDYGRSLLRLVAMHEKERLESEILNQASGVSISPDEAFGDMR